VNTGSRFERPDSEADWRRCLGRKVSLRYRLPAPSDSPFSEAIGVVASVERTDSGPVVAILNKKGETKMVPIADIEVAKVFPI
jgi:ribosome maturation factor RimP